MAKRAEFPTGSVSAPVLTRPDDVAAAVRALAAGQAVGHGFGGFYAITAQGDVETVQRVNRLKGRPLNQVGSIVTTPARIGDVFDWHALPPGLSRARVHVDDVRAVLAAQGFGLILGPKALKRLPLREYPG